MLRYHGKPWKNTKQFIAKPWKNAKQFISTKPSAHIKITSDFNDSTN